MTLKKKRMAPILRALCFAIFISLLVSVCAMPVLGAQTADRNDIVTPEPLPGQQVFELGPISSGVSEASGGVIGTVIWVVVLLLLAASITYMIVNIARYKKAERIKVETQGVKMDLIISEAPNASDKH